MPKSTPFYMILKFLLFSLHLFITSSIFLFCPWLCESAELIDRVVALVDDEAITLNELNDRFEESRVVMPEITKEQVLQTMVNRTLLKRDALKRRISGKNEDEIIRRYINLKVRYSVRINEVDIERFFNENRNDFRGEAFNTVHKEIKRYLTELEVNKRLERLIEELKTKAEVKIQLHE